MATTERPSERRMANGVMRTGGRTRPQPGIRATRWHTEPEEPGRHIVEVPQFDGLRRASPGPHGIWITALGRERSAMIVPGVASGDPDE